MITSTLSRKLLRNKFITTSVRNFSTGDMSGYHPSQSSTFGQDLILVDVNDKYISKVNKKLAHENSFIYDKENGLPHRAFSVFLFNEHNQLLLQQRSDIKITFPRYWTNTCCSHPLHTRKEMEEANNKGIRVAAYERVKFELNYDLQNIDELRLISKALYKSKSDSFWGEYEVDYIFFAKQRIGNNQVNFNKDEVKDIKWVSINELRTFLQQKEAINEPTTPWLKAILNFRLLHWWRDLILKEDLNKVNQENLNQVFKL